MNRKDTVSKGDSLQEISELPNLIQPIDLIIRLFSPGGQED